MSHRTKIIYVAEGRRKMDNSGEEKRKGKKQNKSRDLLCMKKKVTETSVINYSFYLSCNYCATCVCGKRPKEVKLLDILKM